VVVVVVSAMQEKGQKIGEMDYVFRRSESSQTEVVNSINITDLSVNQDTEYFLEIYKNNGRNGREKIAATNVKTSKDGYRTSLPSETINNTEAIKPGVSAVLKLYTLAEKSDTQKTLTESIDVLDLSPVGSSSARDGCDSRLYSERVKEYLEKQNGKAELTFRNVENGKQTVEKTTSEYESSKNAIGFPISIREQIDAKPGDTIELAKPNQTKISPDTKAKIEEMHNMIEEMYGAYTTTKND